MQQHMMIDCGRCPMRGTACGDCVVTALLAAPAEPAVTMALDLDERVAVSAFLDAGLITTSALGDLCARREPFRLVRGVS